MPAHLVHMSPLQKGQVTAAAWCSQRKTLSRIMRTHAALCIHHESFSGFSAPEYNLTGHGIPFCARFTRSPRSVG